MEISIFREFSIDYYRRRSLNGIKGFLQKKLCYENCPKVKWQQKKHRRAIIFSLNQLRHAKNPFAKSEDNKRNVFMAHKSNYTEPIFIGWYSVILFVHHLNQINVL